jgi:hypothetical protein
MKNIALILTLLLTLFVLVYSLPRRFCAMDIPPMSNCLPSGFVTGFSAEMLRGSIRFGPGWTEGVDYVIECSASLSATSNILKNASEIDICYGKTAQILSSLSTTSEGIKSSYPFYRGELVALVKSKRQALLQVHNDNMAWTDDMSHLNGLLLQFVLGA